MEASLVLPVLIFAVITVVLIIMFFYSQMTQRSQMHIALRQEAGRQTETMTSEHVLALVEHLHRFAVVAPAAADLTGDVHVG